MNTRLFDVVANATVKVIKADDHGQAVLVKNGYLITAAHCLDYDSDTGMRIALGDHVFYEIETATGERMQVAPVIIESVRDIAVLGPLDWHSYPPEMCEPFESFCERTRPVPLWRGRMGPWKYKVVSVPIPKTHKSSRSRGTGNRPLSRIEFPSVPIPKELRVHIYTHKKTWTTGKATIHHAGQAEIGYKADDNIEGGTSGGPIVNDSGELVGVVSIASGSAGITKDGRSPVIRYTLPIWIYREICGLKF